MVWVPLAAELWGEGGGAEKRKGVRKREREKGKRQNKAEIE